MNGAEAVAWVEARLGALPDIVRRAEFGNATYFVGGTRFAALTATALVVHLPPADLIETLKTGRARPFVSAGAMGRNGWVEVSLAGASEAELERCVVAAHAAAHHAHRRSIPRRPAAARRTRRVPR